MEHLTLIQKICIWLLPVLFAITMHEVAHGYIASKLGDRTAFILGRISFNPLKHIDLVGSIVVPLMLLVSGSGVIFGWAKPVPINPANFSHLRRDMVLVALAGPAANLFMAIFWASITKIGMVCLQHDLGWLLPFVYMGQAGMVINCVFMVLNLLPLPPLDGWQLVVGFMPKAFVRQLNLISPISFLILSSLIIFGLVGHVINPLVVMLCNLLAAVFGI